MDILWDLVYLESSFLTTLLWDVYLCSWVTVPPLGKSVSLAWAPVFRSCLEITAVSCWARKGRGFVMWWHPTFPSSLWSFDSVCQVGFCFLKYLRCFVPAVVHAICLWRWRRGLALRVAEFGFPFPTLLPVICSLALLGTTCLVSAA